MVAGSKGSAIALGRREFANAPKIETILVAVHRSVAAGHRQFALSDVFNVLGFCRLGDCISHDLPERRLRRVRLDGGTNLRLGGIFDPYLNRNVKAERERQFSL